MRTKESILEEYASVHDIKPGDTFIVKSDNMLMAMSEYAKEVVQEILKLSLPLIPENEWVGQYAEYFKIDRSPIENFLQSQSSHQQ